MDKEAVEKLDELVDQIKPLEAYENILQVFLDFNGSDTQKNDLTLNKVTFLKLLKERFTSKTEIEGVYKLSVPKLIYH